MNQFRLLPKKLLGQNFLIDKNIARKFVDTLGLKTKDFVVEIGPGKGALTHFLIELPINYLGVEIDKNLILILNELQLKSRNIYFEIIEQDFLDFSEQFFFEKFNSKIILIGNIPYYLTSQILFKLLNNRKFYDKVQLMVQREVANRLIGKPGTKDYGILSVLFQVFADVRKLFDVPPTCFVPEPKVFSSVISIKFRENYLDYKNYQILVKVLKLAFNQRRKILHNSLFKRLNFNNLLIEEDQNFLNLSSKRAEELSPNEFVSLVEYISSNYPDYV